MLTRRKIYVAAFCIILTTVGSSASAQLVTVSLAGTVEDPTGAVVPGVRITAVHVATGTTYTTETDATGAYRIEGLSSGMYRVTALVDGFSSQSQEVMLSGGMVTKADFVLGPIPVGSVEVTNPKTTDTDCEGSVCVIEKTWGTADDLKEWLDQQAEEGNYLLAIIPIRNKKSFFLLDTVHEGSDVVYDVIRVSERLRRKSLESRIAEFPAENAFVGIHRLSGSSYLIVLRRDGK